MIDPSLVTRVLDLARDRSRVVLGIAGSPGAGKSTLAVDLVEALNAVRPGDGDPFAVHVPMDGFHLADVELARLGRADRKGAVDTFDAVGYLELLRRLTVPGGPTVYAPAFDREIEQPIAGSIPVAPSTAVVVSEGNYLLLDVPPWDAVRSVAAEVWFCLPDESTRHARLEERHRRFGKSAEAARTWALGPDEANARLIAPSAARADLLVVDGRPLAGDARRPGRIVP